MSFSTFTSYLTKTVHFYLLWFFLPQLIEQWGKKTTVNKTCSITEYNRKQNYVHQALLEATSTTHPSIEAEDGRRLDWHLGTQLAF